jgi:hypothetical protein
MSPFQRGLCCGVLEHAGFESCALLSPFFKSCQNLVQFPFFFITFYYASFLNRTCFCSRQTPSPRHLSVTACSQPSSISQCCLLHPQLRTRCGEINENPSLTGYVAIRMFGWWANHTIHTSPRVSSSRPLNECLWNAWTGTKELHFGLCWFTTTPALHAAKTKRRPQLFLIIRHMT